MMLTKLFFYEKEVNLKWEVVYFLEKRVDCKANSFAEEKKHRIFLPQFIIFDEFDFFLSDILHQLCRCKLAEKIDPFLFQPIFSKDCSKRKKEFLTLITQYLTKVWINELCHQHFPEIIFLDHQNFFEIFQELLKEKSQLFSDQLFFLEGILSLSLKIAEEKRYQLKPSVKPLLKAFLPDQQDLILKISEFLSSLPSLSYEKEKDLKLFEKSAQKLCEIIEKNGGLVWKMKQ